MCASHREEEVVGRRLMVGLLVLAFVSVAMLVGCESDDDDRGVETVVTDDGTVITRNPDGTIETNETEDSTTGGLVIYRLPEPPLIWTFVDADEYASTNFAGYEFEGQAFTNCADFQTYLDATYTNVPYVLMDCVDPTNGETATYSP